MPIALLRQPRPRPRQIVSASARFVRSLIATALLLCLGAPAVATEVPFGLEQVVERARTLAAEPYRDRRRPVPEWMLVGKTTYDEWRDIRFRPDAALWRDTGANFQVQFFHPGLYYAHSVAVNVIENGVARPVSFSPQLFDYGKNTFAARIPTDIGFAGFRVHYPLKSEKYFDEVAVFLGASYFRAVGRDQVYGLSARGLAIDTVTANGEEFPNFTDFWLVEPAKDDRQLVVYALLDSPSVSGAYAFTIVPGAETRIDVEARLFFRRQVERVGVAPLTSMFFFGENSRKHFDDFRPEVHDSDGMLAHFADGEWLWRPLENPDSIAVSSFATREPRGFGLLQRDRDFANQQDLETHAEMRPSAWVEPHGDWGEGHVEVVEIPTDTEKNDNIVAFWRPRSPAPGERRDYSYSIYWYGDAAQRPPGGRVVATRQDAGTLPGARRFVVDFRVDEAGDDAGPPQAEVSATAGEVADVHIIRNPAVGGWRLVFQVVPKDERPVELRAFLRRGDRVLTETWSYAQLPHE